MPSSAIIDVAIGLVFVYVLLSIICSGINEFISVKIRNLRTSTLEESLKNILDYTLSNGDSLFDEFNKHPLIKGLCKVGKKPYYIPSDTFSRVVLDIVKSNDATATDIDSAISKLPDGELKTMLNAFKLKTTDDINDIKKDLSKWFDESMERVTGWYQSRVRYWTFGIALVIVVAFNVDTFLITDTLWTNKELREAAAASASAYVKNQNSSTGAAADDGNAPGNIQTQDNNPPKTDKEIYQEIKVAKAGLSALNLPIGWVKTDNYYLVNMKKVCDLKNMVYTETDDECKAALVSHLVKKIGKSENRYGDIKSLIDYLKTEIPGGGDCPDNKLKQFIDDNSSVISGNFKVADTSFDKSKWPNTFSAYLSKIFGLLFTIAAVSLGAPFWFDLLNKLVNARASGKKPKEEQEKEKKS